MSDTINRRGYERFCLPPMHSLVRVSRSGAGGVDLVGHAYDVSETGVRVELDEALDPGESVCLSLAFPGAEDGIHATGEVVWTSDVEDDPGPRRVGVHFDHFDSPQDRVLLLSYLSNGGLLRAA